MVGYMSGRFIGQRHNTVARFSASHVSIQVCQRTAAYPELYIVALKNPPHNFDGHNLQLLGVAQPGFVLIARIAQTWTAAYTGCLETSGAGVQNIRSSI